MFLTLQIMDLKNVTLTKIIHIVIKAWMHNTYDINLICYQNIFMFNMYY
jgi:hypothetical protein